MLKRLGLFLALLLGLALAIPWVAGWQARRLYQELLAVADQSPLWVSRTEFHPGWRHTQAMIELRLPGRWLPLFGEQRLRGVFEINHSWLLDRSPSWPPPLARIDGQLRWHDGTGYWLPLTLTAQLRMSNQLDVALHLPSTTWVQHRGLLTIAELEGRAQFNTTNPAQDSARVKLNIEQLATPQLAFDNAQLRLDADWRPAGLHLGVQLDPVVLWLDERSYRLERLTLALTRFAAMQPLQVTQEQARLLAEQAPLLIPPELVQLVAWWLALGTPQLELGPLDLDTMHGLISFGVLLESLNYHQEQPDWSSLRAEARLAVPTAWLRHWLTQRERGLALARLDANATRQLTPELEQEIAAAVEMVLQRLVAVGWLIPSDERLLAVVELNAEQLTINQRPLALSP